MVAGDTHRSQGALLKPKPQLVMKDSYENTRNGGCLLLKMWPFLVCFPRYRRKKALLQEKYSSDMHANDLNVWDSLEAHHNGEPGSKMVESLPFGCNDRTSDNLVCFFSFFLYFNSGHPRTPWGRRL